MLALIVQKSFDESDGTYGYRRVHADLVAWGVPAGPELVRSIMRERDLEPCQPRPWLWVPKTYATRRYSWITPPARSRRWTRNWSRLVMPSGIGRSGAACFKARCGRCVL